VGRADRREGDALVDGELACAACPKRYAVRGRIPQFIEGETYVDSFGWQWKRFAKLQRDSYNGSHLVRDTILRRSGWSAEDLAGKRLLECGCGSGNDSEVLATYVKELVSIDLSAAVDAFDPAHLARPNVLVLRADLRNPPLKPGSFDIVYCHRVIMHTPDPPAAFRSMVPHVRPGGCMLLHSYDTHWKSRMHFKYWLRPLLGRTPHSVIYRALRIVGPVLYPLVGVLNRIGFLRRWTRLVIPFENHDRILQKAGAKLTRKERYDYSFLITFDDLTPAHDHPSPPEEVERWFVDAGLEVTIRSRNPVIALGRRPASARPPQP
jgi:SAM-dependent methyltransferase